MEWKSIAQLVNDTTKETIGESAVLLNEDLSNTTDFGTALVDADMENKFLTNFVDRINRVIMYAREYNSNFNLGIFKDNMEYGTILQRMSIDELYEAESQDTYALETGTSVDPFVVRLPKSNVKYFDKRNQWEIDMTILDRQYRSAFTSPSALGSFVSMIFTAVNNSKNLKVEAMSKSVLRAAMSATLQYNYPTAQYSAKSTMSAVNLLKVFNDEFADELDAPLTVDEALHNELFLKTASKIMNEYVRAIKEMSVLYNIEGAPRFTPADKQKLVILGRFSDACQYYLDANTYHETLVKLPQSTIIDNWQGTGDDRTFAKLSSIDVKNADGDTVQCSNIVACLIDTDGMGVTCQNSRVLSQRNEKGEYTNFFYKSEFESVLFKDMNCVVFFMA